MAQATLNFPPDFLWGTTTAAHQVEGGNTNNDWWAWEQQPGHILNVHRSGLACNWWANAEADLDLAAAMGTNAHRLSLEWSRIEPEPAAFDQNAIARYRQILQAMHERAIEPMVTLHHFSNPLWLVERGDFDKAIVVDYFQRYVATVVNSLGDLIPKWVTINEPMDYIRRRYWQASFPAPARRGWPAGIEALAQLLRCHAAAYHTIKATFPQALVGVTNLWRQVEAHPKGNGLDRWWARRVAWFLNNFWLRAMTTGRPGWPLGGPPIKNLAGAFDFVGLNYYGQSTVRFPPRGALFQPPAQDRPSSTAPSKAVRPGNGPDALGGNDYQIYPGGLYEGVRQALTFNKPIYITGNGLADASDGLRPGYLLTHLRQLWLAVNFCFPVMGYYYHSLVDSFEWEQGWTRRFGLIAVDSETQERRMTASGRLYGEICRSHSLSSQMAEEYAPELLATMFPGSGGDTGAVRPP